MKNLLSKIIKESSFYKKLIIGMIFIAIIPTFLTVSIMYNTYSRRMIDEISNANLKILGQIRIYFDAMLYEMTSVVLSNSTEKDLLYFSKNHFSEDAAGFNRISGKLSSMSETNSKFDSAIVYFENFKYVIGNPIGSPRGFNYLENISDRSWLDFCKEEGSGFILRDLPNGEKCLSLIRPIKDSTSQTQAVMAVSVAERTIYNNINKLKTHGLENIYIVDSKGNILFHIGDNNDDVSVIDTVKQIEPGDDKYFVKDTGSSRKVFAYTVSNNNGWKYISVTDENHIFEKISLYKNLTILIAIMVITASILFSIFYGRYLYKPISSVFENIKFGISKDRVQGDEFQAINKAFEDMVNIKNNLQNLIDENKNTMKDKLLNNIVLGYDYNQNNLKDKLEFFGINLEYDNFCVLLASTFNLNYNNKNENQVSWKVYTLTLIQQLINDMNFKGIVFETNFENLAVILNFDKNETFEIKAEVSEFCRQLHESLAMTTLININIGVGGAVKGLDMVSESFRQASKALDYNSFLRKNSTVFIEDILCSDPIAMQSEKYEKRIDNLIQKKDKDGLNNLIEDIINESGSLEAMSRDNIINFFSIILSYSLKAIEKSNAKVYKLYLEKPIFSEFLGNQSLEGMAGCLKQFYINVVDDLNESADKKGGNRKFHKAQQYILENYYKDLTLTSVAEKVSMNANYLSNIFKDETGKNFIDFVNLLRVEKSKEFLHDSGLTISEIALKVGFTNDRSLTRSFRKYEGCTPGQYRDSNINSKSNSDLYN